MGRASHGGAAADAPSPTASIASYLPGVHAEAIRRGYSFDATKIATIGCAEPIETARGQLDYEWTHLKEKLRVRTPVWLASIQSISQP